MAEETSWVFCRMGLQDHFGRLWVLLRREGGEAPPSVLEGDAEHHQHPSTEEP